MKFTIYKKDTRPDLRSINFIKMRSTKLTINNYQIINNYQKPKKTLLKTIWNIIALVGLVGSLITIYLFLKG